MYDFKGEKRFGRHLTGKTACRYFTIIYFTYTLLPRLSIYYFFTSLSILLKSGDKKYKRRGKASNGGRFEMTPRSRRVASCRPCKTVETYSPRGFALDATILTRAVGTFLGNLKKLVYDGKLFVYDIQN